MAKRVNITPAIERMITSATGDDAFDFSKVALFEGYFVNTRPLNKPGSLFHKGRVQPSMINAMAEYVQTPGKSVPLQTMHERFDLPVGRVVYAEVERLPDEEVALRGLFFLSTEKQELVDGIDTGVIDEVSIGAKSEKMLCSECGFDYMSDEADFENLYTQTCNNGHTVGEDGVHVRLIGLDQWYELSLVGRGASNDPKILPKAKQRIGQENVERLAASGCAAPEAVVLFATSNLEETNMAGENKGVDLNAQLIDSLVENRTLTAQNTELNASVASLKEQVATLTSEKTALEAKLADDDSATKLTAAETTITETTTKLGEHYKAARIALGETDPKVPETLDQIVAGIEEAGVKLHQLVEGKGVSADAGAEQTPKRSTSAFQTRK